MMKRGAKIVLSLLIAVLISSVVTFVSFVKGFALIETGIYAPNLKSTAAQEVEAYRSTVSSFLSGAIRYFGGQANADIMRFSFSSRQLTAADIALQQREVNDMFAAYPGLINFRLVDPSGLRIHFSSDKNDIKTSTADFVQYQTLDQSDASLAGMLREKPPGNGDDLLWDSAGNRIIFRVAVAGTGGVAAGYALAAVKAQAVEQALLARMGLVYRDLRVANSRGLLIDVAGSLSPFSGSTRPVTYPDAVNTAFTALGTDGSLSQTVLSLGNENQRFLLYTVGLDHGGVLGVLYPMQRFAMGMIDKFIILAVFYVTIFLLVFFIGNIRQDPLRVVTQRMHQFQVEFLREFFEKRDQINVTRWQKEIDSRRDEIKRYMKRGIKKLSETKETEIDSYIIDGWNEVISIIKSKIQKPPEIDMARIETLLRKVLEEQHVIIARGRPTVSGVTGRGKGGPLSASTEASAAGGIPEVEELESLASAEPPAASPAEELEEIPEAEVLERAVPAETEEEIPEAELVTDLEQVEDLEEVPAAGSLDAATQLEDLEELSEAGSLDAAAPPEDLEELSETEPLDTAAPPEDLEELSEAAPLDEGVGLEELEEVPEAEPLEGGEATTVPPARQPIDAAAGQRSPVADEGIELLTVVPEIKVLPPLPFEKLEELQIAEQDDASLPEDAQEAQDFVSAIDRGEVEIKSVLQTAECIADEEGNIVLRDGVYRIKDDLYKKGRAHKPHRGLRELAQSLLETRPDGISSIDELYPGGDLLEEPEQRRIQERQSLARKSTGASKNLQLTPAGLDLDAYLEGFSFQITDKVLIYAIGELMKKAKAVSAVLFGSHDGFHVNLAIGLTNRSANQFNFPQKGFLFRTYLQEKAVIFCQNCCQHLQLFTRHLSSDDLKFIRSALFIPAVLEKKNAYVFLGFTSSDMLVDKINLFKKMDISARL